MNKESIFYNEYDLCRVCAERTEKGFQFIDGKAGEVYEFNGAESYTILFFLKGKIKVQENDDLTIEVAGKEMMLLMQGSKLVCQGVSDFECVVLKGSLILTSCDQINVIEKADKWLYAMPSKKLLTIKPRLMDFLISVINYLNDGITCPYMHKTKETELSTLFRAYYTFDEISSFFFNYIAHSHEFESFVMRNYLKMKGVKEFVDLSGMTLAAFNKKFKSHFKETPYQWLIKQKSKHIYHELSSTYKSFTAIAKEYHFSDSSHFNRYCKAMFGASPSQIRENELLKK